MTSALSKTCQLRPAPTWLVKQYRQLLSPFVARLFNEFITTWCFPPKYKDIIVTPLLKKSNLDASLLKSYQCQTWHFYLNFWRKPSGQRQVYLDNDAMLKHQSPSRRHHSTKTALVKVYNDLLMVTDNGQISAVFIGSHGCIRHGWPWTVVTDSSEVSVSNDWHYPGSDHTGLAEPSM